MLVLVTIFLITLLTSALAIWIYRWASGWHGFKKTLVGRKNTTVRMQLKSQQGYISLNPVSKQGAYKVKLRSPKGGIKAPWGW